MSIILSIGAFILKLILMIFVLGIIILVHEFGHFIWAKHFGVHIYEFSIGMGPLLHSHKGKDGIDYNIRAIPIGGYVSMAGEVYDDVEGKIPKKKLLCNKPWWQRLIILVAGVTNNFIMAILLLVLYAGIWGGGAIKPVIDEVVVGSAAEKGGLQEGDTLLEVNGYNVKNWDKAQIIFYYKTDNNIYDFKVKHEDGTVETLKIKSKITKDEETGTKVPTFGFKIDEADTSNVFKAIGYGFEKFGTLLDSMVYTIWGLISGKISIDSLSGPVGIYQVVGESLDLSLSDAVEYLVYILAFLSINVGFINILPFPAFDGGHVLFLLIERIKGSKINAKLENTMHLIGFALIILLMIIVTINDIIKLF